MATKPKPKPKPPQDLRKLMGTSSLAGTVSPTTHGWGARGQTDAQIAAAHPTLQDKLAEGPPVGSYDPQLDAQGQNQWLGGLFTAQDKQIGDQRALEDYGFQTTDRDLAHGYTLSDLVKARDRDQAAYNTATQDLGTQYGRLGTSQTQAANAAGVGGGGALVAAAMARQANQAHDQAGLDTTWTNQQQDIQQGTDRENAAYQIDRGDPNAPAGSNAALGRMGVANQRGAEDRQQTVSRWNDQNALFGPQLTAQKTAQAVQGGGWLPDPTQGPKKPYEEFTSYSGTHKGIVYHRYPDGTVKPVRKVGY